LILSPQQIQKPPQSLYSMLINTLPNSHRLKRLFTVMFPLHSSKPYRHFRKVHSQASRPWPVAILLWSLITTHPSQILISHPLLFICIQLALGLNRRSTLPHLVPEMQTLLTSEQKRLPSKIAVDVLAAVRRVDPLACRSAVAFGWTLEGDCNIRVR